MKQITIYDLLPLLKPGYVAMDKNGEWWWYITKPKEGEYMWINEYANTRSVKLSQGFNIAPFDGDWKDSLRRIK